MILAACVEKHSILWRNRRFVVACLLGVAILMAGVGLTELAREHLENTIRTGWAPDLLLDVFPVLRMEDVLVWGSQLLLLFVACIFLLYPETIPFSFKTVGLLYAIRSFFIILTPLGNRPDQLVDTTHSVFYTLAYSTNEFFFSGHVSFPFLFALLFWNKKPIRYMMLAVSVLFGTAVLFAHTHYSIDVFAVPFIVPSVLRLSELLFENDLEFFQAVRSR
jgi:hypothetical protein